MIYRNFNAHIAYSEADCCFVGHVAGIGDVVGFHGENPAAFRAAFEEAVDDYLATCEKLGKPIALGEGAAINVPRSVR
jgi:predicted HicB family RNase H-like nuclease